MITNCAWGSSTSGTCHAQPRSGSARKWNSSITTCPASAPRPSRNARFARISAVQQTMGASALTEASPVTIPTRSAPNASHRAKNFSFTRALMGAVYQVRRPSARAAKWAPSAINDFPEPVGVVTMTLSPARTASSDSSWCGYSEMPEDSTHSVKTSRRASGEGSRGRRSLRFVMTSPILPRSRRRGVVRYFPKPEPRFALPGTGIPGLWVPCEPGAGGFTVPDPCIASRTWKQCVA